MSKKKKKKWFSWKMTVILLGVFIIASGVAAAIGYLFIIINGERLLVQNVNKMDLPEASIVYDVNGQEITKLFRENREMVDFSDLPVLLRQAFIATEDKRFENHAGLDYWAIGRALYKDIIYQKALEGGSTITQQLAKNLFLSSEKTLFRKATEASIAMAIEKQFSKDQILELYLNRIYFGNGAYGVKAAAKLYYGKTIDKQTTTSEQLSLAEIATLAGIPKSPNQFNPIDSLEKAQERRFIVLKLMFDQGYITAEEREKANIEPLTPPPGVHNKGYMTFVDYMLKEASAAAGISDEELLLGGYKIYTTMDNNTQYIMEQAFADTKLFQEDGPEQMMQGTMVVVDHKTGAVVAMIGGRDYVRKGLNRAVLPRQPGSAFKPLAVYAPAIETGNWNPFSKLKDEKQSYNGYSPNNYDNKYLGETNMIHAVRRSLNAPAVWLLNQITLQKSLDFIQQLEIPLDKEDRNLAIALGGLTYGATPLDMARAYGAFANQGKMHSNYTILRIVDADNKEVYHYKPTNPKRVMSTKTAYYMTQLLKEVVDNGTGVKAKMSRPAAGKTGSTQVVIKGLEKYDSNVWFVGYTPEWTAAVWMGFDKTDKNHYIKGGSGIAAAMFQRVMSKALEKQPASAFIKPADVPDLKDPPPVIKDLRGVYTPDKNEVQLLWSPLTNIAGNVAYKVYRKSFAEDEFKMLLSTPLTEVKDWTIAAGETYLYYVTAYYTDNQVESDVSNIFEVEIALMELDSEDSEDGEESSIDEPSDGETEDEPDDTVNPDKPANNSEKPINNGPV